MRNLRLILVGLLLPFACYLVEFGYGVARAERYWLFDNACARGDSRQVQWLLRLGADPNGVWDWDYYRNYHWTAFEHNYPLWGASWIGHADVARILIAAGARLDVRDGEGTTAVFAAVIENHPDVLQVLLDAGAPTTDLDGDTALAAARRLSRPEIIQLLEQRQTK
jgi:ankyrin repeat protein